MIRFYLIFSFKKDGPIKRRTKCEKILLVLLVIFLLAVIVLVVVVALQRKEIDDVRADVTGKPGKSLLFELKCND